MPCHTLNGCLIGVADGGIYTYDVILVAGGHGKAAGPAAVVVDVIAVLARWLVAVVTGREHGGYDDDDDDSRDESNDGESIRSSEHPASTCFVAA